MKEVFLASFFFVVSLLIVILFILFGWYIVWKLIISRFKFIKELLKGASDSAINDLKVSRKKIKKTRKD